MRESQDQPRDLEEEAAAVQAAEVVIITERRVEVRKSLPRMVTTTAVNPPNVINLLFLVSCLINHFSLANLARTMILVVVISPF